MYVCVFFKGNRGSCMLKMKIFSTHTQPKWITFYAKLPSWTKILETYILQWQQSWEGKYTIFKFSIYFGPMIFRKTRVTANKKGF